MNLVAKANELGVTRKGEFIPYTNFVFDVIAAVEAPPNYSPCSGFLYSIRTNTEETGDVFISNVDASSPRMFVLTASRIVPSVQHVRMRETLWHRHVFNQCQQFNSSPQCRKLILAVCLGQQPNNDV